MKTSDKFQNMAEKLGAKIHRVVQLGSYIHIDTNKESEIRIREMLAIMRVKEIMTLEKGIDGKHLDGSRYHRIVAKF